MISAVLLSFILLSPVQVGKSRPIGKIEFFGYSGIDINALKIDLPVKEGDLLNPQEDGGKLDQTLKIIESHIGHAPTDVSLTCCDKQGRWLIYIGLSGTSLSFNEVPKGEIRLPPDALNLYENCLNANSEAVTKGIGGENQSNGYAISEYPPARAIQLKIRSYALANSDLLRDVLAHSADDQHRIAAAHLLGYAKRSKLQINCLVEACKDNNDTVRNNAIRALGVLAASNSRRANEIPAEGFIELLLSGKWTDLNKVSFLLSEIARARDKKILTQMQQKAVIDRLTEMARWRDSGHSYSAKLILGRMAGIEEKKLLKLIATGTVEDILKRFQTK